MRWPAVEAIARALDLEDELDGEAVARLMAQQPATAVNAEDAKGMLMGPVL